MLNFRGKKLAAICLSICCILLLGLSGDTLLAVAIVYPESDQSVNEMYENSTDFLGGKPGKLGKSGKAGQIGKLGKSGKSDKPGQSGKHGRKGKNGKGRFVFSN